MALEKPHSIYNFVYLTKNLEDTLRSQHFSKVSKVFIEFEKTPDSLVEFEESKFYYALEAIANMIQMTVFLPNEEQCEIFKRKTERHFKYVEVIIRQKKNLLDQSKNSEEIPLLTDQSSNTISSIIADNDSFSYISPISDYNKNDSSYSENMIDDNTSSTISTMSFQYIANNNQDDLNKKISSFTNIRSNSKLDQTNYDESDVNLIENHFKPTKKKSKDLYAKNNYNEMETSLDEGIGSSGSLSNNQPKSSPNSLENFKSSPIINEYKINQNQHTIGVIDDIDNENINDEDDNDNETHLGDVVDRCEGDFADLDADVNNDEVEEDDEIDINVDDNENEMNSVLNEYRNPYNVNQDDDEELLIKKSDSKQKQRVKFSSTETNEVLLNPAEAETNLEGSI